MADLIDRHALIKEISKYHITSGITAQATWNECVDIIIETLESFPSAQPERKTGQLLYHHTEDIDEERTADVYFCSSCKEEVLKKIRFGFCGGELDIHYGFCPICGADMRGESDETD